ncbi:threonine aspartase 1 isoform X2 [Photinus pyralis]|uniref:Threonine aspartase 1 n=2 Tax=Photinus pyralis TaxID=7054 RepID=A0A1Y1MAZ2_PHOPY|nr:threonine aspartase 1 isoform X2 [Photinus pyralis]
MKMTDGFIAVHCGAGHHKDKFHKQYNKLSKLACKAGTDVLKQGGSAIEAVKAAVLILENDPLTNAGYGSNLTTKGQVEGDAAIMDGKTLLYGGCGAVQKVKNPIELAYDICIKQREVLPMGLIPPSLLVGEGGFYHAKAAGLEIVKNKQLISHKALRQFKKYKKLLNTAELVENSPLDTVGAICVDGSGHVASACSSGGLLLKRPGRVGQAALYACGMWADSFSPRTETSVAVCTTGCESRHLRNIKQKLGGALVLHLTTEGEGAVLWGHSTETMSVGYMKTTDVKPKALISQLPQEIQVGSSINVGGTHFILNR